MTRSNTISRGASVFSASTFSTQLVSASRDKVLEQFAPALEDSDGRVEMAPLFIHS
jgi:hypothetical protein